MNDFDNTVQGGTSLGKQINYYIEYDSFVLLAQKALDLGCKIIKEDLLKGVVIESDSIDILSEECYSKLAINNDYELFRDTIFEYADRNLKSTN